MCVRERERKFAERKIKKKRERKMEKTEGGREIEQAFECKSMELGKRDTGERRKAHYTSRARTRGGRKSQII